MRTGTEECEEKKILYKILNSWTKAKLLFFIHKTNKHQTGESKVI